MITILFFYRFFDVFYILLLVFFSFQVCAQYLHEIYFQLLRRCRSSTPRTNFCYTLRLVIVTSLRSYSIHCVFTSELFSPAPAYESRIHLA
uniref:AlNc14C457G11769 protein n=1 Tax=Albugo laibachii Nc14 TaxID=890382 RepID=F0X030_9STRA|nr:AlNc14C457G11769 [Albugo laibachii Nc14]|eukprot:CCA27112.1 AlNc14C457G11769 [Albugo laibachii Nc14]